MGAFDGELAALGYGVTNRKPIVEAAREQIQPVVGEWVEFWHPVRGTGYHLAEIKHVSAELVVVRHREPQKSKWGQDYCEEALRADTHFYKARGGE